MTGSIWNTKVDQAFFEWDLTKTMPKVMVWLIYGLIFFGRKATGLRGKKPAQGAILGFFAVIGSYFLHI